MATNIATVTAKGQVTIPKRIRQALGLEEKDRLLFVVEGERVIMKPLRQRPLNELYGTLPATKPHSGHQAIRDDIQYQ